MTASTPTKTTIQIDLDDWRRLNALKLVPGESLADVLRRLLDENSGRREPARDER